ncbi:SIS domain-containing protein [Clostridium sp. 'deep sea']|uniref:SIS domain-containing protein n=1 Tax=Clostridium sp. 'deep sea' TaxID=2779445 RepID=UPI001896A0B3|nr:SIS domain-containing protein [Clostridium sp. 'deep sea']QOR34171.1 SIS domain-containing protein [Clostridium sp. 'deep sea']
MTITIPNGAKYTYKETMQQPQLWAEVAKNNYQSMISKMAAGRRIILTGAGSSSFVGQCTAPFWSRTVKKTIEPIATTDIVAVPYLHLRDEPTLLVSMARSGNSPESVAAVKIAEQMITDLKQIFITCNENGALANYAANKENIELILMPKEADDQAFAMTSSFTTMVISTLLLADVHNEVSNILNSVSKNGQQLISNSENLIKDLLKIDFNRIVFLGDGDLTAMAREASLKMLELTAGKVVPLYDSLLGFRHGPKTFINNKTIIVTFLSNNKYTQQYQLDLITEINRDNEAACIIALSSSPVVVPNSVINYVTGDNHVKEDIYLMFNYLLFAQILVLYKSILLEIDTDNPMPSGTVNRVVKGVTIHQYKK